MKNLLTNKFTLHANKSFDYQEYLKNEKKKVLLVRMKDLFQKYISTRQEKTIAGRNVCKIDKKWFPLPRKPVSTNRNAGLI